MNCHHQKYLSSSVLTITAFGALLLCDPSPGLAVPILGPELASFAVLGASNVTSANVSNIGGNLGSFPTAPTTAVTNFNFITGSFQPGTQATAQTELTAARTSLGLSGGGPASLDGTWLPGTHDFGAGLLTGALVLDGTGFGNTAVWVFRFASSLTTEQGSSFSMINVGDGANVGLYWNVGESATLNGDTFGGNVLALTSITTDGNLQMGCGRLLADNGLVSLDGAPSTISIGCSGTGSGSRGFDQGTTGSGGTGGNGNVPEPATLLLLGSGLVGLAAWRLKKST